MRLLILSFLLLSGSAMAQDAAQQAMQAANDAAQQSQAATQLAIQTANQTSMQASQTQQQALIDAGANSGCYVWTPKFSVKGGTYSQPLQVVLTDRKRNAVIFYTTDGWKPTVFSPRFDGPITIDRTTHLHAVAYEPGCGRSEIVEALYTLPSSGSPAAVAGDSQGVLHAGTEVPLRFATAVDSRHAQVGQMLELATAVPVTVGEHTFPAGTVTAQAVVTAVHRGNWLGMPADLSFVVRGMTVDGATVPLRAERTAEPLIDWNNGAWKKVPSDTVEAHGRDLTIPAGAEVTATVSADTQVKPD